MPSLYTLHYKFDRYFTHSSVRERKALATCDCSRRVLVTTKEGIALRLHEWANMRTIIDSINDDFPTLARAIPCYMQTDHQDAATAITCLSIQ